jgi:hypothetical protein
VGKLKMAELAPAHETSEKPHEWAARLLEEAGRPWLSAVDSYGVVARLSSSNRPHDRRLPYLVSLITPQRAGDMQHETAATGEVILSGYFFSDSTEPGAQRAIFASGTDGVEPGLTGQAYTGFSEEDDRQIDKALTIIEQAQGGEHAQA